jgi:integrase/recombinase XerD
VGTLTTCLTHWQARLKKLFKIAGIPDAHSHQFRDTFAVGLLSKGVGIEKVAMLLGHQNIKITQKHYAPWVKARADFLEAAVGGTW